MRPAGIRRTVLFYVSLPVIDKTDNKSGIVVIACGEDEDIFPWPCKIHINTPRATCNQVPRKDGIRTGHLCVMMIAGQTAVTASLPGNTGNVA